MEINSKHEDGLLIYIIVLHRAVPSSSKKRELSETTPLLPWTPPHTHSPPTCTAKTQICYTGNKIPLGEEASTTRQTCEAASITPRRGNKVLEEEEVSPLEHSGIQPYYSPSTSSKPGRFENRLSEIDPEETRCVCGERPKHGGRRAFVKSRRALRLEKGSEAARGAVLGGNITISLGCLFWAGASTSG